MQTDGLCKLAVILTTGALPMLIQAADAVASPRAVPTFECVGLYWKAPGGAPDQVLGEGASEDSGQAGREAYRSTSTAEAVWDTQADAGVKILITVRTEEYTRPGEADSVAERERTWHAAGVLDCASKEIRWLAEGQDSQT